MGDVLGHGASIDVGDGASPEVFSEITGAKSITIPDPQPDDVEVTDHDSASNTREYIAGLIEPGECSFELNFNKGDTQHTQLQTDKIAGTKRNYKITIPTSPAETYNFSAYVKGFATTSESTDVVQKQCTLKVSGPVTVA